jgi:hypothetical protein
MEDDLLTDTVEKSKALYQILIDQEKLDVVGELNTPFPTLFHHVMEVTESVDRLKKKYKLSQLLCDEAQPDNPVRMSRSEYKLFRAIRVLPEYNAVMKPLEDEVKERLHSKTITERRRNETRDKVRVACLEKMFGI